MRKVDDLFREALKSLFNDELLVDAGWDWYIDLLLSQVDSSLLRFFSTNGFPFQWPFVDGASGDLLPFSSNEVYRWGSGVDMVSGDGTTIVPGIIGGDVYLKFNRAPDGSDVVPFYLDFGSVSVECNQCQISLDGTTFTDSVTFPESETPVEFIIHFLRPAPDTPASDLPFLQLSTLPDGVNPGAIMEYRAEHYLSYNPNFPVTSPAELWAALINLRIDSAKYPFRVVFESGGDRGYSEAQFKDYVRYLSVDRVAPGILRLVSAEDVLISAVRDRFGTPEFPSTILGYDKRLWVVVDNAQPPAYTYITTDYSQAPSDISVFPEEQTLSHLAGSNTAMIYTNNETDTWDVTSVTPAPASLSDSPAVFASAVPMADNVGDLPPIEGSISPPFSDDYKLLISDRGQSPAGVPNPAVAEFLISPQSEMGESYFGVLRDYQDLSIISGPLSEVSVVFTTISEEDFEFQYPGVIAVMRGILAHSVPAGTRVSVGFEYPQYGSSLRITDEVPTDQSFIRVNGKSYEVLASPLSHNAGSSATVNLTTPDDQTWTVNVTGDAPVD